MKAIVFSRDRAMQLDLLLNSLEWNAPGLFEPVVIWYATSAGFEAGYYRCIAEHPEMGFMREDGLTYQVRHLLKQEELVMFFTDDDVLYRPLEELPDLYEGWICFSLRLGRNTTYCYPLRREQAVPLGGPETTVWNWPASDGDFGYPMSLDGHIFRATDLLPVISGLHFSNPNSLEEALMRGAREIGRPLMACFHDSCLVGIPLNRVNTTHPNRNGGTYSVEDLNCRFLEGQRIDLDGLDFSDVRGAHQEIPLVFK